MMQTKLLHYMINTPPIQKADLAENQRIESAISQDQADGRVEVRFQARNGLQYTITRSWGGEPIVLTADSGFLPFLHSGVPNHPGMKPQSEPLRPAGTPQPFRQGILAFYPTRVELCGVKVCGDEASGMIRHILDALRSVYAQGCRRSLSGQELSIMIGSDGGPTAVAGAIRNFRNRAKRILLAEARLVIDPSIDLIVNDRRHGYRFSDKLTVVEHDNLLATNQNDETTAHAAAGPAGTNTPPCPTNDDARGHWILAELKKTGRIRKHQIVQRTGCSDSTARRALARLRDNGRIVFVGSARTGYWRLA